MKLAIVVVAAVLLLLLALRERPPPQSLPNFDSIDWLYREDGVWVGSW